MSPFLTFLRRVFRPLGSRKVRVALVTVVAAYLAEAGLGVSEEVLLTILGAGCGSDTGHSARGCRPGAGTTEVGDPTLVKCISHGPRPSRRPHGRSGRGR